MHAGSIPTRREFLKRSTATTIGAAVGLAVPRAVHAQGSGQLKIGLVGAGGRGLGAAVEALAADARSELTAVADVFEDRARQGARWLVGQEETAARVRVEDNHIFWGFDAYRQVVDSGVDVVILATPPHFRPAHLEYAVSAGKHCFVEKPVAVDAPGVKRVIASCQQARAKGLSVVSGLCWRYHRGVQETIRRIQDGAIGDIVCIESCYNTGTLWHRGDRPEWSRMEYQIRNWLYYTWLSGDHIVEQAIHSLDKAAWLLADASPVRATGSGGRQQRTDPKFGNIFDHHCVNYEYPSGIQVYFSCRQQDGCSNLVDEYVMGTKGTARVLKHEIQRQDGSRWNYDGPDENMYRQEQEALFASIREGHPINDGPHMVNSTMIAIMGRMCTYTGQTLTWDECVASRESLGPAAYKWVDVPEPPVAIPGKTPFV